jgi:hypothetical protein
LEYTINNGQGDSDDKYHALIHQAAHDYYYGHRFGLISPPKNNHFILWTTKTKKLLDEKLVMEITLEVIRI